MHLTSCQSLCGFALPFSVKLSRPTIYIRFKMGGLKKEFAISDYGRVSFRNLGKSQLGGVIFGTKTTTIKECLSKQLFGLPSQHYVYVKKVDCGLPLFLFNYSDRTLHGIFEAASSGQMNIDPYAWTTDGSDRTPYPAQVQIRLRLQCQALTENQFKPIIDDNYYSSNLFWFELDHAQTNRLLSMLSSLAVSAPRTTLAPRSTTKWTSTFPANKREEDDHVRYMPLQVVGNHSNGVTNSTNKKKDNSKSFNGEMVSNEKEYVYMKLKELALNHKDDTPLVNPMNFKPKDSSKIVHDEKKEDNHANVSENSSIIAQLVEKVEDLMAFKKEQNDKIQYLEQKINSLDQNLDEAEHEIKNLKRRCNMLETMVTPPEEFNDIGGKESSNEIYFDSSERNESHLEDDSLERNEIRFDFDDSIFIIGGYDGVSWLSSLDCYSPSKNLTKSLKPMNSERCYAPVSVLDGELFIFGGGTGGTWYDTVESYDPVEDEWTTCPPLNEKKGSLAGATLKDKIYAVGGGNGRDCYSTVEMLDFDIGAWIPTQSMLQKRFALAAAELNGALYAVGGYDGKSYLNSAERFDPREHSWTKIESMKTARGCPSLVVLNEKLYALGGYDGNSMVPTVEIYDPRRGSWMIGETMNYARGFSAAAVVKESIYIFGGLKTGEEINDTVECYKEGQGWEITITNGPSRRCFFSATAL